MKDLGQKPEGGREMMEGVRVPGCPSEEEGGKLWVRPGPLGLLVASQDVSPIVLYLRSSSMCQEPCPFQEGLRPSACSKPRCRESTCKAADIQGERAKGLNHRAQGLWASGLGSPWGPGLPDRL